jgi:hypothetical protein
MQIINTHSHQLLNCKFYKIGLMSVLSVNKNIKDGIPFVERLKKTNSSKFIIIFHCKLYFALSTR